MDISDYFQLAVTDQERFSTQLDLFDSQCVKSEERPLWDLSGRLTAYSLPMPVVKKNRDFLLCQKDIVAKLQNFYKWSELEVCEVILQGLGERMAYFVILLHPEYLSSESNKKFKQEIEKYKVRLNYLYTS